MYFPLHWIDELDLFKFQVPNENFTVQLEVENPVDGESLGDSTEETEADLGAGQFAAFGDNLEGVDKDKWGDLIGRLEENTGFIHNYEQTYEGLIKNNQVSDKYVYRNRRHEDIVIKEVFPTIHDIDRPFSEILKAAPEQLADFEQRNEIIEQFRNPQIADEALLSIEVKSNNEAGSLGPLDFPAAQRQRFFDETLSQNKTKQLTNFIDTYFNYDPNEGDLAVATRELYFQNLERLLYTFSTDSTYFYLDFYLENLNKEDFLHNALFQASRLDGSKTATELLFSLERIYEIQQRAWTEYFKFSAHYDILDDSKKSKLRTETLNRVKERYKSILENKGIKDARDIGKKYRQRRYEVLDHIVNNTPESYRLHDALFERAVTLWEMGIKEKNNDLKKEAVNEWMAIIKTAQENNYSEEAYNEFINLEHLQHLNALLALYIKEGIGNNGAREQQINNMLAQRQGKRLGKKREREEKILWPKKP